MEANHITFQGIDGAECERFIKDIRKMARNAGRSGDNSWILNLVSDCLKGTAWKWYVRLDPAISEDWGKLQIAMVDRWPDDDPIGEGRAGSEATSTAVISTPASPPPPKTENVPAPAPAPAPIANITAAMSSMNLNELRTGRVRIDCPGSDAMYIPSFLTERNGSNFFTPCSDKSKALIVEISQRCVHHPQEIKLLNSPDHRSFLGIAQDGKGTFGVGSSEQAFLVTADWAGSSYSSAGVIKTAVWSICPFDNTIRALWQADGCEFLLKAVVSSSTNRIVFASDLATLRVRSAANRRAQFPEVNLVFEAIS